MTTILIVDEDTDVLRLLRIKLNGAGYDVIRARDGEEALAAVDAHAPDLMISELLLPDMDGSDLLARASALPASPVILALSSDGTDAAIAGALAAGAVDFIAKPFSPQALLERVRVNLLRAGLPVAGAREV